MFKIYMLTCLNGKKYIGCTKTKMSVRFKTDGRGYIRNTELWNDICLYSFSSFEKQVLAKTENIEEAKALEKHYISKYQTQDPQCGYNHTGGGEVSEVSETGRSRMSKARTELYQNGYEPIWVNDQKHHEMLVDSNSEIPDGYTVGRLNRNRRFVHKSSQIKYVSELELDKYLKNGWELGRGNLDLHRQQYVWMYDGQKFKNCYKLAAYLNKHGYPKIAPSTITKLFNQGFETSKTYSSLAGKITREPVVR